MTQPVGEQPGAQEPADGWGWQHLHPLSPLLRGGFVLLAIGGYFVSQGMDSVLGGLGLSGGASVDAYGGDSQGGQLLAHPVIAGAVVLVVVAAIAAGSWLSWRFSRFRVARGQVELRTGILFRQHRQVPLERVQAVEISRPLLARVFGVAQVVVQSAGGRGSHLSLTYLGLSRAHEVRDHLLELAGRSDERPRPVREGGIPEQVPAGPWSTPLGGLDDRSPGERAILQVPNGRLFVATLLHTGTLILGVALVVGLVAAGAGAVGILTGMVPFVIGVGGSRVRELLHHGNFTLSEVGENLRVRHGLTDLRTTTVPLHRIQAIEVIQHVWWRPLGWWRVRVNVAGVHRESGGGEETTILPVGTFVDVCRVLGFVDARLVGADLDVAASGEGGEAGWTGISPRARALDPLSWRRAGYAVSADSVLLRRGRLTRAATIVPHARIQSLSIHQGMVQRALGVASVRLVSTPGPVDPVMAHLTVAEAERMLLQEASRAGVARRRQHTWGQQPPDTPCEGDPRPSGLGAPVHPQER